MWPWIKRWRDWAMHDLWPLHRIGPQPQAMHYSYEKAGLTVDNQPIPWNADAVLVECLLRLPAAAGRRKADFTLHLPEQPAIAADTLRADDGSDQCRLFFRLAAPAATAFAEMHWRGQPLGRLQLPVLTRAEFLQRFSLQMPTLAVMLGEQTVACQTFVATQCRGIMASALLTSATSLAPVVDLNLRVEFRTEEGESAFTVPLQLSSSQLRGKQALVTVSPGRFPKRVATWVATWMLEDQVLATQRIRAIPRLKFQKSLRISDTRFVVQTAKGPFALTRQLPPLADLTRVGPCFLVSSSEPGMAGLCKLEVRAQVVGGVQAPLLLDQEVLITDGPSPFAPGTVDAADLAQMSGFDLRLGVRSLGVLPLASAPTASFTSEGGFKSPGEFTWSAAADELLSEKLARLMEGRNGR